LIAPFNTRFNLTCRGLDDQEGSFGAIKLTLPPEKKILLIDDIYAGSQFIRYQALAMRPPAFLYGVVTKTTKCILSRL